MNFTDYQKDAEEFAAYPDRMRRAGIVYAGLVLTEEAGGVAGKIKRYVRGELTYPELQDGVEQELGDVLWAMAELCNQLELSLELVAQLNLYRRVCRKERGVLYGSGDNR
jgi:NTP pyrophosphatase (non-canonical NTP hydrolase)